MTMGCVMALDGKRILVVEDEYLIAADLKRSLRDRGAEVVGPVGDLAKGLALARYGGLDAAVLDINLEGDASFPIADVLAKDGVPFVFLTGYDAWSLPDAYAGTTTLAKPYINAAVMSAVELLCQWERTA